MYPFRVFISYAHEDAHLAEDFASILQESGYVPVWDRLIRPGSYFIDTIQEQITTAHIFMPLLTDNSSSRPWIHQEIGLALGVEVPVIPVVIGGLPGEMIQGVQAIFAKEDLSDLASKLKGANIKQLVNPPEDAPTHRKFTNTNEVVYYPEERTQLLIAYSQRLHDLGRVRQRGLFSSFSLPADSSSSKVWNVIDLASPRSEFYREKLREERRILEKHARSSGCSLIINPFLDFRSVGASVHRAQLAELLFFIKSMEADELTVVISNTEFRGNLTIVGDWFGAKTPPPQPGVEYRQTVFCRHAATVFKWIQEFDQELNDSLVASKIEAVQSRDLAISRIEERLQELPLE